MSTNFKTNYDVINESIRNNDNFVPIKSSTVNGSDKNCNYKNYLLIHWVGEGRLSTILIHYTTPVCLSLLCTTNILT